MNLDRNRIIHDEDSLLDVAHKFQETPYRRLPVLHGTRLAGQVSRRDVLRAEHRMACEALARSQSMDANPRLAGVVRERTVGEYMDDHALTASPNADMLTIAQMFLNSPYRRLPILDGDQLVGQVSRRDLLEAAAAVLRPIPHRNTAQTLYLSPLSDSAPPSLS
jgi:CBS domain-containing protein